MFTKDDLIIQPDYLKREEKKLINEYFNDKVQENSIDEYIENHASNELKTWYKEEERFSKENLKKGIIYN